MVRYFRRVIRIRAQDSPSVRYALRQKELGLPITHEELFPGVLTYREYLHRRATWDPIRQQIGLDAEFYEGKDVLLFPPLWLDHAHEKAVKLGANRWRRKPKAMGIDTAEGGDDTSYAIIDEHGLIALHSMKTPDTNDCFKYALAYMRQYEVPAENVLFDRGGDGKAHADRLINAGYNVRSIGFGERVGPPPQHGVKSIKKRIDEQGERYVYKNNRAEMYWNLSYRMDPSGDHAGFAIPLEYSQRGPDGQASLREQLAPFPKRYDDEGRIYLPPKGKAVIDKATGRKKEPTLTEIIGRSPDDADALVLALHAMTHPAVRHTVGML